MGDDNDFCSLLSYHFIVFPAPFQSLKYGASVITEGNE